MTEVTPAQFWDRIGPADVAGNVEGPYPYTTIFRLRQNNAEIGRCVDHIPAGKAIPESRYFLSEYDPRSDPAVRGFVREVVEE